MAGYSGHGGAWLVVTDNDGHVVVERRYGGSGSFGHKLTAVPDGGFAIVGHTREQSAGGDDGWLIRTDFDGNRLWDRTYGDIGNDYLTSVVVVSGGGYAVGGLTNSAGAGSYDFQIRRLDAAGDVLWERTYGGQAYDELTDMVALQDGFAAIGYRDSTELGGSAEIRFIRTDLDGNLVAEAVHGGTNGDFGYGIASLRGGGFILAGRTFASDASGWDARLLRVTSCGAL